MPPELRQTFTAPCGVETRCSPRGLIAPDGCHLASANAARHSRCAFGSVRNEVAVTCSATRSAGERRDFGAECARIKEAQKTALAEAPNRQHASRLFPLAAREHHARGDSARYRVRRAPGLELRNDLSALKTEPPPPPGSSGTTLPELFRRWRWRWRWRRARSRGGAAFHRQAIRRSHHRDLASRERPIPDDVVPLDPVVRLARERPVAYRWRQPNRLAVKREPPSPWPERGHHLVAAPAAAEVEHRCVLHRDVEHPGFEHRRGERHELRPEFRLLPHAAAPPGSSSWTSSAGACRSSRVRRCEFRV